MVAVTGSEDVTSMQDDLEPRDVPDETGESGPAASTDRALARLDGLPLADHPDVYDGVHAELRTALSDIDDA